MTVVNDVVGLIASFWDLARPYVLVVSLMFVVVVISGSVRILFNSKIAMTVALLLMSSLAGFLVSLKI